MTNVGPLGSARPECACKIPPLGWPNARRHLGSQKLDVAIKVQKFPTLYKFQFNGVDGLRTYTYIHKHSAF